MKVLDNSIESLLGEAGLNDSERQVYLAGSSSPMTSAQLIVRTKMPRPTVMAALKSLRSYGLCQTVRLDGRSLSYNMQQATALKQHLGEQARKLDDLMDRLDDVRLNPAQEMSVREVEGQEALQDVLELALRCKSRQWRIIAPHDNALRFMPKSYTDYFKRVRRERQITSQTLWEPASKDSKISLQDVLMRKPRFVPAKVSKDIPSLMLAFDDTLLVIDGTTNPRAVIVQSPTVTKTFGIIFELAWRNLKE